MSFSQEKQGPYNASFFQDKLASIMSAMKIIDFNLMFVDAGYEDKVPVCVLETEDLSVRVHAPVYVMGMHACMHGYKSTDT